MPEMSPDLKAKLAEEADPDCDECDGTGIVSVIYNNDPRREEDTICECIVGAGRPDWLEDYEPHDRWEP
jgi:hypothetical protein